MNSVIGSEYIYANDCISNDNNDNDGSDNDNDIDSDI